MKKTVEDYKVELNDKINNLIKQRNDIILKAEEVNKQLQTLMEQQLALDETKIKANCIQCNAKGWIDSGDGKKVICPICGGNCYMWVEKYTEDKK